LEVGGRVAVLKHVYAAHTDGDTWVMFPDANVLMTGDVYGSRTYPNLDWGSGGTIDGMILASKHSSRPPTIRPRSCPATWAAPQGITSGPSFLRNVYNSFRNHN
jgi:hypothetical protein